MFKRHDCMEGHIILGVVLTLVSAALLAVPTFSPPFIKGQVLAFLAVPSKSLYFGVLGYCEASHCATGISVSAAAFPEVVRWLEHGLLMVPIGAALELITFMVLIIYLTESPWCEHHMWYRITSWAGGVASFLGAAASTAVWLIAKRRFEGMAGADASLGNAPMGLVWGGAVAAVVAMVVGGPPYGGRIIYRVSAERAHAY